MPEGFVWDEGHKIDKSEFHAYGFPRIHQHAFFLFTTHDQWFSCNVVPLFFVHLLDP